MFGRAMITAAFAAVLSLGCAGGDMGPDAGPTPIDATAALGDAAEALGAEGLDSITYSGTAWSIRNSFMQTPNASPPWPVRNEIRDYVRTIDLTGPVSRATGQTLGLALFLDPLDQPYNQNVNTEQNWANQLEIWITPWGFLRGAEMYGAEAETRMMDGSEYKVVTFMSPESVTSPGGVRYTVNGYINSETNLIERVETWVENSFIGDMHVVGVYSDYQDFDGLMVPTTMEKQQVGGGVFGVTVTDATANPANLAELIPPPEAGGGGRGGRGGGGRGGPGGRGAAEPPTDLVEQIDEGVYLVTGGYVALAVEFSDHVAVFEAGQPESRGEQIIAEVRRAIPDKPIRYVINSHPHSDHTGGLVPFIREGITLITHDNNVEFMEMALSQPRTLLGEATLSPQVEGTSGDVRVLEDDTMRLELLHVPNGHQDGMLVAFLPEQRILFQADFSLRPLDQPANPFVVELAEYVDAQGIDFDRYLAVHAASPDDWPNGQTKADLMAAIGQ